MTEAEQNRIVGQVAQELKAETKRLACLEYKAEKVANGLRQMIDVLEGRVPDYDINPEGCVRVGFEPIYTAEQSIVSLLEDIGVTKKKIAKLQSRWDSFGLV